MTSIRPISIITRKERCNIFITKFPIRKLYPIEDSIRHKQVQGNKSSHVVFDDFHFIGLTLPFHPQLPPPVAHTGEVPIRGTILSEIFCGRRGGSRGQSVGAGPTLAALAVSGVGGGISVGDGRAEAVSLAPSTVGVVEVCGEAAWVQDTRTRINPISIPTREKKRKLFIVVPPTDNTSKFMVPLPLSPMLFCLLYDPPDSCCILRCCSKAAANLGIRAGKAAAIRLSNAS